MFFIYLFFYQFSDLRRRELMCVSPAKTNCGWNAKTQAEPHDVFLVTYVFVWGRAVRTVLQMKYLVLSWTEELLLSTATSVWGEEEEEELLLGVVASDQLTRLRCRLFWWKWK